jgi:BCD family chlorophyll transporter-like MFS transporter
MAFLMTGLGLHMTQTAGLALASDQATDETRPRVVALMYMMFLVGIGISAVIVGALLSNFSEMRLVQVVQGTALVTLLLNIAAVWKQESMHPMTRAERAAPKPKFSDAWRDFSAGGAAGRLLLVVAIGTCAFSMQDVLLEPYGGEVLGLSVSATTFLTAIWALGALIAFALAARWLAKGVAPYRMASWGALAGIAAFAVVIASEFVGGAVAFFIGASLIGFGGGLFAVAMLTGAMTMPVSGSAGRGLALGAWGAAQATALGIGTVCGGGIRDAVRALAPAGEPGGSLAYSIVYQAEIVLLIATLILIRPLTRLGQANPESNEATKIGLSEFPT